MNNYSALETMIWLREQHGRNEIQGTPESRGAVMQQAARARAELARLTRLAALVPGLVEILDETIPCTIAWEASTVPSREDVEKNRRWCSTLVDARRAMGATP